MTSHNWSFLGRLPEAAVYPFRGTGWLYTLFGAVLHFAASSLMHVSAATGAGARRRGGAAGLALIVTGYLLAYVMKVVNVSADGDRRLPAWPSWADWRETCLRPLWQTAGLGVVVFGPGFVAALVLGDRLLVDGLFLAGSLYVPMGFLGVALERSVAGIHPVRGIATIRKAPLHYGMVSAVIVGTLFVSGAYSANVVEDGVSAAALSSGVSLYCLLVEAHVLGLFYHANEQRFDWFGEADGEAGAEFHGIGVRLRKVDRAAEVVDVLHGSGAETAGLSSGDRLHEIEGVSIADMSLDEITDRIQGPSGTTVHLTGEGPSRGHFDAEVLRRPVDVDGAT